MYRTRAALARTRRSPRLDPFTRAPLGSAENYLARCHFFGEIISGSVFKGARAHCKPETTTVRRGGFCVRNTARYVHAVRRATGCARGVKVE